MAAIPRIRLFFHESTPDGLFSHTLSFVDSDGHLARLIVRHRAAEDRTSHADKQTYSSKGLVAWIWRKYWIHELDRRNSLQRRLLGGICTTLRNKNPVAIGLTHSVNRRDSRQIDLAHQAVDLATLVAWGKHFSFYIDWVEV